MTAHMPIPGPQMAPGATHPAGDGGTEPPAVLLRRAADLIEQRAAKATPGPWYRVKPGSAAVCGLVVDDDERRYLDGRDEHAIVARAMTWEGLGSFVRRRGGRDLDWIRLVHPGIAAPLAAWLRSAAEDAEQVGADWQALALARALLGEDTP